MIVQMCLDSSHNRGLKLQKRDASPEVHCGNWSGTSVVHALGYVGTVNRERSNGHSQGLLLHRLLLEKVESVCPPFISQINIQGTGYLLSVWRNDTFETHFISAKNWSQFLDLCHCVEVSFPFFATLITSGTQAGAMFLIARKCCRKR